MGKSVREITATGRDALLLVSRLLMRARLAGPDTGIWEPADPQWWWRRPRPTDDVEQLFWVDDDGPVAGVYLTAWREATWQCDLLAVPGAGPDPHVVWERAEARLSAYAAHAVEVDVPVRDDDPVTRALVAAAGFRPGDGSGEAWLTASDRPAVLALPDGFGIVDRTRRMHRPHPMRPRNGAGIARRLAEAPLYEPSLDLCVETADGEAAAYSLYWFDPTTRIGLVEPVRVEEAYQRRGLARAMISEGVDRLARRGAERIKIGYESEAAAALYTGLGFVPGAWTTWWERR